MSEQINENKWVLKLYIAGMTPTAQRAIANIRAICDQYLQNRHSLEVIDLVLDPEIAENNQIFAVPTLIREIPPPVRKIIGDFSDKEKVICGLDIQNLQPPEQ